MKPGDALALASLLHAGQLDKAGQPYLGHLERVAAAVKARGGSDVAQIAAALHDAIEDGRATDRLLAIDGVPDDALRLVALLTKSEGQHYLDYLANIKANPEALLIKLCDIADNSDPGRLAALPSDVAERLRTKYARAVEILMGPA